VRGLWSTTEHVHDTASGADDTLLDSGLNCSVVADEGIALFRGSTFTRAVGIQLNARSAALIESELAGYVGKWLAGAEK
jgi:hypothetical protein